MSKKDISMTSLPKTALTLVKCSKTFPNGARALEQTSLDIQGGETIVLLGPSGCGKTTLLRIIAGLESPDRGGSILFNGEDVTELPIEKRNVGMVFQSYALFPNMNVQDNVGYGLKVHKVPPKERALRVDEVLEMMQIEDLRTRRIDQLSGGQKQRLALARAIAQRPRVLLLDEPLTALDALLRDRLRVEIDSLLRRLGITSVYVTHDQAEAMALGDRIVVMSKGQIEQIGSPRQIYFEPQTEFVADFIGTVNTIPQHIVRNWPTPLTTDLRIRPEDLTLTDPSEAHFVGHVETSLFMGDRTRYVVQLENTDANIVIDSRQRKIIAAGEIVGVKAAPEAALRLALS